MLSCRNEDSGKGKTDLKVGVEGVRNCSSVIYVFVAFRLFPSVEKPPAIFSSRSCVFTRALYWYIAPEEGQGF